MRGVKDRTAVLAEASLLLAVFILGTNPVAVKVAVSDIPPLPLVALRFTIAGLLVLGIVVLLEPGNAPVREDLLRMTGVGLIGVGMNNVTFTLGVSMTTASDTALLYATVPVWGMILGLILGLERPVIWGILGMGLAFLGVGIIVHGSLGSGRSTLEGNLLVVAATVCWASYPVFSLPLLRHYSPLVVATYTMLFGGLAALPLALTGLLGTDWETVSGRAWVALAYSTLFVSAFGFYAWQSGTSRLGATSLGVGEERRLLRVGLEGLNETDDLV